MTSDNGKATALAKTDLAAILADMFAPWVQDLGLTIESVEKEAVTTRMPASGPGT